MPLELLTAGQIRQADGMAASHGLPTMQLMENAGRAVTDIICKRYAPRSTLICCGPGNNGGDGYVIARLLYERGWPVAVTQITNAPLHGDAFSAAQRWRAAGHETVSFSPGILADYELIVDAIFGVGLSREPEGQAAEAICALSHVHIPIIAVDIPSGVFSDTGEVPGDAVRAEVTVTLFRAKPGLFLLPGKAYTGEVIVADIGITESICQELSPQCFRNGPAGWTLPKAGITDHKYMRGHVVITGGGLQSTGAAKLAALAALRAGAGLVSVACPDDALAVYATSLTSVMTKRMREYGELISDPRVTALLLGPGNGVTEDTRAHVLTALATGKPCVLDADALSVFADHPMQLFSHLHRHAVLTPHEGEFFRLFDVKGSKLERTRAAADKAGCTVLLKGSDTVIAQPNSRTVINANAPPWLATAGAGDVLAGLICGLMAQHMDAFNAACAGAWLHGEAAHILGSGLIAEDLPQAIARIKARMES